MFVHPDGGFPRLGKTRKHHRAARGFVGVLPDASQIQEFLTEPAEVTRWGIALASLLAASVGAVLGWAVQ